MDARFETDLSIVGDVRIDNRTEFLARCGIAGGAAANLSDVELIALGWSRCEERVFDAIVGPYALAIWRGRRKQLVLARDPQGLRPLFFHCGRDWVAFASLPNALAALPEIGRHINEQRVLELLLLVDPQDNPSFFDGIEGVRKGEIVRFDAPDRVHRHRFWNAAEIKTERRRPDDHAEGLRERLVAAVEAAVDTPKQIATTLSGGFDSGVVTALAANRLQRDNRALHAYTAVPAPDDPPSTNSCWLDDETELAAAVARRHANIRHRCITPPGESLMPTFDFFFDYVGAPCLMPSISLWYAEIERQAVADGAEIMLMATGGNWTVSYHGAPFLLRLAERGDWLRLIGWLVRLRGGHPALDRERLIRTILRKWVGGARWERLRQLAGKPPQPAWNAVPPRWSPVAGERLPEFLAVLDPHSPRLEILHGGSGRSSDRRVWLMRETLLPLYEKAVWLRRGIEVRDPTLDRRVVEFCLSIPDEEFLRGGHARAVFRRAFGNDVPAGVLANVRIGRQGYGRHSSMRRSLPEFRDEVDRVPEESPARRLFDLAALARLAETPPDTDDGSAKFEHAYTLKLSRGISALHFVNRMGPGN
ncbi:MAG: asparagine synthase-related protein [Pseudomonadota bacterium]